MPRKLFITGILVLMMAGCASPPAESPSLEDPTVTPEDLAIEPTKKPTETPSDTPTKAEPTASETVTTTQPPQITVVPPSGSVDVGELTPETESEEEGELVEMPAPGVPTPQVRMVSLTSQDLSQRLGIDLDEIQAVEVLSMEWRDSSLGCRAPGMFYLQVITPGYKITLAAGGQEYTYHTDMGSRFVLCVFGRPEAPLN